MAKVALRPLDDSDLDTLFDQMRDRESVQMAAFTAKDPDDRQAFDAHMARVRSSPSDNIGSLKILHEAGFRIIDTENSYANARRTEIEETLLRLD